MFLAFRQTRSARRTLPFPAVRQITIHNPVRSAARTPLSQPFRQAEFGAQNERRRERAIR